MLTALHAVLQYTALRTYARLSSSSPFSALALLLYRYCNILAMPAMNGLHSPPSDPLARTRQDAAVAMRTTSAADHRSQLRMLRLRVDDQLTVLARTSETPSSLRSDPVMMRTNSFFAVLCTTALLLSFRRFVCSLWAAASILRASDFSVSLPLEGEKGTD